MSATLDARSDLQTLFDHVAKTLSEEEQQELLDRAREIEERRTGLDEMTEEEEAAIVEAEAQEKRGEIASDEELAEDRRRYVPARVPSMSATTRTASSIASAHATS